MKTIFGTASGDNRRLKIDSRKLACNLVILLGYLDLDFKNPCPIHLKALLFKKS
jgi:hypothetical protein